MTACFATLLLLCSSRTVPPDCIIGQKALQSAILDIAITFHKEQDRRYTYHFRARGPSCVYHRVKDRDKTLSGPSQVLYVSNSRYSARAAGSDNSNELVVRFIHSSNPRSAMDIRERNGIYFPIILNNRLLTDWCDDPNCRVLSTRPITRNGQEFNEITLEHMTDPTPLAERGILAAIHQCPFTAKVIVNPNKNWRIEEVADENTVISPSDMSPLVSECRRAALYGHLVRGVKLPRSVTFRTCEKPYDEATATLTIYYIDSVAPCDAEDEHFRLSHYGLPEPPGVTWERPTPWWLYGIFIGFALVILSGILYKVVGRWRTQATKPQPG